MDTQSDSDLEPGRGRRVLLAMSGGVDSSVAAALLLERGYDVVGCFMRLGSPGETVDGLIPAEEAACDPARAGADVKIGHQGCCSVGDAADARLVAAQLGVPLYVCNFKRDFGRIVDYFVAEYSAGRTPNPCVRCNDWLKFGKLHDYAAQIGAAFVASGHYARVTREPGGGVALRRGVDGDKDQSYVLFGVGRERLGEMLLPIGGYRKAEVRRMAEALDLPVFDKPDSQEICFVPDNDYAGLVERRNPGAAREGRIVDTSGRELGRHRGQHRFTVGQRRGVGVALGYPIYVVEKDAETNTVTVGDAGALRSGGCEASEVCWLAPGGVPGSWARCLAQCRYNGTAHAARVRGIADGPSATYSGRAGRIEIEFDGPQRAVAPGQAVVLYAPEDPGRVLGGGWITRAIGAAGGRRAV